MRTLPATLILSLVLAAAPSQEAERWRGAIDLSGFGGPEIEFFVVFSIGEDGGVSATISIPIQGVDGLPLTDVVYDQQHLEFTLVTSPNNGEFRAAREGDTATGTLTQGVAIPITLRRLAPEESAGPDRPQTPHPPFPYTEREVIYANPVDGNNLAGTLGIPAGAGPHPAVLLITGSGAQDRDETIFAHKPFWVIADHLTRNGIAVLRVDDRGVGGSDRGPEGPTTLDFAGDVLAGVKFLGQQPEIDGARIGLIGHSEGGLIAPIAAAQDSDISFIVLLAGTGISGRELMPLQLAAVQRAVGRSQKNVEQQLQAQARIHALVIAEADQQRVREAVGELVDIQLQNAAETLSAVEREQAIKSGTRSMMSGWYRTFLITDPRHWLAKVRCPVLAINGTLDLQVPADANLPAIERALHEGGNQEVAVHALEGLNHLFQHAQTGSVAEYGQIEETFALEALELITEWIRGRTGLDR